MTTDIIIYASCGIMVVLAIVTPLINIFFRRPRTHEGTNEGKPSFSIIIPAHENASELERHLPAYLKQVYDGDFEVIVVESKTGDRTEEVVKHFASDKRLYSTFIPSTSKYMSRKKLAMTVGAKAAKYDWLIFADAECYPAGNNWLATIAKECSDDKQMVIGYGNYEDDANDFWRYVRMVSMMYALRKAEKGTAYRAATDNVAIRRDLFMKGKGFEGNLMFVRGEYDFIVNKFAEDGNTAVVTDPEGWTLTDTPTDKTWKNTNLFYVNARRSMKRSTGYRAAFITDTVVLYLNYLIIVAGIVAGILLNNILLTAVAAAAMITCIVLRLVFASKALDMYGEDIPLWKILSFEKMLIFHDWLYRVKHRFADKNDFTSHKL